MAPPKEIIDAHHHLWNPASGNPDIGYGWLKDIGAHKPFGDPTPIQRDYLLDEFLAEPVVTKLPASVHLQADGAIPDPVVETRFIQQISEDNGFMIAIVGFVDLADGDAQAMLERHRQSPNFRGVRQILSRLDEHPGLSFAPAHHVRDERWRDQYALLAEHGLSFDLQCYPEQMAEVADFLARHPGTPVILDHAGSPWDQSSHGVARWREGISRLAALPHVSVKLAGFGMFDANWNGSSIRPLFETIIEQFGWNRMMFASNFPVDKLMCTHGELLDNQLHHVSQASEAEQTAFFMGNARRIYRI